MKSAHPEGGPARKAIFAISTDGMENSGRKFLFLGSDA